MKTLFVASLVLLSSVVQADPYLIVPGVGIGQTHLGPHGATYLKKLPKPDAGGEASMGQTPMVWTTKAEGRVLQTLYIHTTDNGYTGTQPEDGVTIDEIRVTSPVYHTRDGLHTGSTFSAIRREYPGGREVNGNKGIYDVVGRGVAFEFATGRAGCIAITVHTKGAANGVAGASEVNNILKMGPADQPQ